MTTGTGAAVGLPAAVVLREVSDAEIAQYIHEHDTGTEFAENTPYSVWYAYTERVFRRYTRDRWQLGDALRFGERKYGEMYSQAIDDTHLSYGSLTKAVSVANRVEFCRRRQVLPWSWHEAVASLPPIEQEEVLTMAEQAYKAKTWDRDDLRLEVKRRQVPQTVQVVTLPAETVSNGHGLPAVAGGHNALPTANGNGHMIVDVAPVLDFRAVENFDTSVFVRHDGATGGEPEYAPLDAVHGACPSCGKLFDVTFDEPTVAQMPRYAGRMVFVGQEGGNYLVRLLDAAPDFQAGEVVDVEMR